MTSESLLSKIKVAWFILFNEKACMSVKKCEYCESVLIKKVRGTSTKIHSPAIGTYTARDHIEYEGQYVCTQCGAICFVGERWEQG